MTFVAAPLGGSLLGRIIRHLFGLMPAVSTRSSDSSELPKSVITKAQQGNQAAFRKIVLHYDDRLRALAFRLLEDRQAMDDALQEAYVKAFRSINGFKGEASLGTWLYRITYNTCMDELRKRENVRPIFSSGGADLQLADPIDSIAAADTRTDLTAALSTLPAEQRAAIFLIDAEGWGYDEAARVLGIPPGTVASRVSRARVALRSALGATR